MNRTRPFQSVRRLAGTSSNDLKRTAMKSTRPIRWAVALLTGLTAALLACSAAPAAFAARPASGRPGGARPGQPRIPGPQPCRIPDRPGPDPYHHHRRRARLADHPHRGRSRDPRRRRSGDPRPGIRRPPAPHYTQRLNMQEGIWRQTRRKTIGNADRKAFAAQEPQRTTRSFCDRPCC
jgi:hypothetical protein